jgi:hypothetical protein
VGGHLPGGERAVREVPQRSLARDGLVDGERRLVGGAEPDEQGEVGRVGEGAQDGEVGSGEQVPQLVAGP